MSISWPLKEKIAQLLKLPKEPFNYYEKKPPKKSLLLRQKDRRRAAQWQRWRDKFLSVRPEQSALVLQKKSCLKGFLLKKTWCQNRCRTLYIAWLLDFCANGIFGAICQNLRSKVINGPKATFCMNIVSFFFTVFAWRFLFAFVEMPMGYWLLYRQCPISFIVCLKWKRNFHGERWLLHGFLNPLG